MVMGGKRYEYSPEDYIDAAVQLFLDIIYIFIYLLQIIGFANKYVLSRLNLARSLAHTSRVVCYFVKFLSDSGDINKYKILLGRL